MMECVCGGEVRETAHEIGACVECGLKYSISHDAEFEGGAWRDRTTIALLLALRQESQWI